MPFAVKNQSYPKKRRDKEDIATGEGWVMVERRQLHQSFQQFQVHNHGTTRSHEVSQYIAQAGHQS